MEGKPVVGSKSAPEQVVQVKRPNIWIRYADSEQKIVDDNPKVLLDRRKRDRALAKGQEGLPEPDENRV